MRLTLVLVFFSSVSLCGCLSTVRVKSGPAGATSNSQKYDNVPGIPFYTKTAMCKQETVWTEPVYTLALKRTTTFKFVDEAKAKAAGSKLPAPVVRTTRKVLSLSQFHPTNQDLQTLLSLLNKSATSADPDVDIPQIDAAWDALNAHPDYVPLSISEDQIAQSPNAILIAKTSAPEAVVDYATAYYFNAPRPWVGSSQIDEKLAADGTLTEGSAQVQSQTLSTILTAVTSIFTSVLSKVPSFGIVAQPPDATTTTDQYELTVQKDLYQHLHSRYVIFAKPCPIELVTTSYALTISAATQAPASKDDPNTVKVSGTITLPKSQPATPVSAPK
jgi:hypothetical protein